jgi:hypothetical protein
VRNASAVFALLIALLALGVLAGAAYAARTRPELSWVEAGAAVPAVGLLALLSLSLASRGRARHQLTLGRAGGAAIARLARLLGLLALLLVVTAGLAFAVFAVLVATDFLTHAPW